MRDADQRREYRLATGRDRRFPDEIVGAARAAAADTTVWAPYQFEYVSPVAWMAPTSDTVWTLDFSIANRGGSLESFAILLTEFHFAEDQPSFFMADTPARPGRVFLINWGRVLLDPAAADDEGWWSRIYTSSPNLVPSIHFYVDGPPPSAQPYPDVYFGRGDFERYDVRAGFVPPAVSPPEAFSPSI